MSSHAECQYEGCPDCRDEGWDKGYAACLKHFAELILPFEIPTPEIWGQLRSIAKATGGGND